MAYDFFKDKFWSGNIGIKPDGTHPFLSCYCSGYEDDDDKKECDIKSLSHCRPLKKPLFTLKGPVWISIQKLQCTVHETGKLVDFWDPDFKFGETDEWWDESKKIFAETNGGICQVGSFYFSAGFFRYLWCRWNTTNKIEQVRASIIELWLSQHIELFTDEEYKDLKYIFKCDGESQVFEKLIDLILPSTQTLNRIIFGFGWDFNGKLYNKLVNTLCCLGQRWLGVDATFSRCKGIIIFIGVKSRFSALTIKAEWGHFFGWEYLPDCKESYRFIVPPLARIVKKILKLGPVRTDQEDFQFSCDEAEQLQNLGRLTFKYIKEKLNNGRNLLTNEAGTHTYNLTELGRDCNVEQDIWHAQKRIFDDKVLLKGDPEYRLAVRDLTFIYNGVKQPGEPIILNGLFTGINWYSCCFEEKFADAVKRFSFELDFANVIDAFAKYRRSYQEGIRFRNEALIELESTPKYTECCDIMREILNLVHPAFWLSLFARWGFRAGDVLSNWLSWQFIIDVPVYNSQKDYKDGNVRWTKMNTDFVSIDLIETILGILRWPKTTLHNFGYQTFEHYMAHKRSFMSYWASPHYVSFEVRIANNMPLCVISDEQRAQNRIRLCLREKRMRFEYNNTLFKTLVAGTQGIEFTHGVTNYNLIWKCQRRPGYGVSQNLSQTVMYNMKHHEYVFVNIWNRHWPKDIKSRLQEIYTEFRAIYRYIKDLRKDPRNPCIRIEPNHDVAKQLADAYFDSLDLPLVREPWNKRKEENDALLFQLLLANVKLHRIKLKFNTNNTRTNNPKYKYRLIDPPHSDSSDENDIDDYDYEDVDNKALDAKERKRQNRILAPLIAAGDKRLKNWWVEEIPELKRIETVNRSKDAKRKVCLANDDNDEDAVAVTEIIKNLDAADLSCFQFETPPKSFIDEAFRAFRRRHSKATICNKLNYFSIKVAR